MCLLQDFIKTVVRDEVSKEQQQVKPEADAEAE
jgi:hypothetical protein